MCDTAHTTAINDLALTVDLPSEPTMLMVLNTDPYIDDREAMCEHLESVVREVLGGHDAWIIRVAAYLSDANGAVNNGG